jgi:multiple antibiotic resistance protein
MTELALAAFANFFITIDPVGVVPFFIALTAGLSPAARRAAALKGVLIAGAILLVFTAIGQPLLHYLGITLPAFRIAGGALLFLLAVDMVVARESGIRAPTPREEEDSAQPHRADVAVFPLAIPLIAGPGAIASTILLQSQHAGDTFAKLLIAGIMLGVLGIAAICFFLAEPIMKVLGLTGVNVLSRVLGIVLAALAVNNIVEGLRASFPALGG